jgi:hypothetical protein
MLKHVICAALLLVGTRPAVAAPTKTGCIMVSVFDNGV